MAGDWIKMRTSLWTHPKVNSIALTLGIERPTVIGCIYAVWSMADEHTEDGVIPCMNAEAIDLYVAVPGFAAEMSRVGWIEFVDDDAVVPRFDEHNGQSAKRRATEQRRKAGGRKPSATRPQNVRSDADKKRGKAEPEKRREEKIKDSPSENTGQPDEPDPLPSEEEKPKPAPKPKPNPKPPKIRDEENFNALIEGWNSLPDSMRGNRVSRGSATDRMWEGSRDTPEIAKALRDVPNLIAKIRGSPHLHQNREGQGWFSFGWLFRTDGQGKANAAKIAEGWYLDDSKKGTPKKHAGKFTPGDERPPEELYRDLKQQ